MIETISKFWEFVTLVARAVVKIDDALIEVKTFWDWLAGNDDDEPEPDN